MKKFTALFAGLIVSGAASAIQLDGTDDVLMTDCGLLANDITITLTNNVVAGMQCDETNNYIALSGCHTSGLVSERSAVVLDQDGNGTNDCTVGDTEDCVVTVTGAAFPTANTANGTVASQFPGSTCSVANAETNANAQTAPE